MGDNGFDPTKYGKKVTDFDPTQFGAKSVGKRQVVPQDILDKLSAQNAQNDANFPQQQGGGALRALGSDLLGMVKGLAAPQGVNPGGYPNVNYVPGKGLQEMPVAQQPKMQAFAEGQAQDQSRQAAGYNKAYRVLAPVAQGAGTNVSGMEASAAQGDTSGVLGHAVAPVVAYGLVKGAAKGLDALPSKTRAAANFQEVMQAAKDKPIDIGPAGDTALRTSELAGRGGSMPKVIRDFMKRVTDPTQGPMTYAEARDFYSNATRLSGDEFQRLTPVMRAQVAEFTANLGKSIGVTAEQAGVGPQYQAGMKEYHQAATLGKYLQNAKKVGVAAGAGAAGMGIAHKLLNP
jgi:hypothetical protein